MGGFFQGMIGDLLRMLKTDSPLQWDLAVQLAQTVASEGQSEGNVEPADRIRLEGLLGVAELHVADVTGMTTSPGGRPLAIVTTGRAEWARRSLETWRPVIEKIATALGPQEPDRALGPESAATSLATTDLGGDPGNEEARAAFLGRWTSAVAPAMIAMQVGSVVGHLAQRTLGQYDLPLPRRDTGEILVVPANAAHFAEDWSLPPNDLALWLCVRDVAMHTVLTRQHVRERLEDLLSRQAQGFRPDPTTMEERLGQAVSGGAPDVADLTRLLGDPGSFGVLDDSPELRQVRAELSALSSAIEGYVEWVTDTVAARSIGTRGTIREALRRRRVERGDDERVAESLFGFRLDQDAADRGESFVRGILERGGETELVKLWQSGENLPTPAELDAPGLWIERINLPELGPGL